MIKKLSNSLSRYYVVFTGAINILLMALIMTPQPAAALTINDLMGGLNRSSEPKANETTNVSDDQKPNKPADENDTVAAPNETTSEDKNVNTPVPTTTTPDTQVLLPSVPTTRTNQLSQGVTTTGRRDGIRPSTGQQLSQVSVSTEPTQSQSSITTQPNETPGSTIFGARNGGSPITYSSSALSSQQTTYGYAAAVILLIAGTGLYAVAHFSRRSNLSKRSVRISTLAYK